MANTATVTAKTGPGKTATAVVISNVTSYVFNLSASVLFVYTSDQPSPQQFELTGSNTITMTASGYSYSLTIA